MADRFPLVVDSTNNNLKELPSGDNLDLTGSGIKVGGTLTLGGVDIAATGTELNILDGVTATAAELNYLDITTLGTSAASKAVTADANGDVLVSQEFRAVSYNDTYVAVTGTGTPPTVTINCETGNYFYHLLQTGTTTFVFSNPPDNLTAYSFILKLKQDSTARDVTWPGSVDWAAATAPTISTGSGDDDFFVFTTSDGGQIWYGFTAGQAMA